MRGAQDYASRDWSENCTGLSRLMRTHCVIARSTATAYLLCHCEEHRDVAISMRLNTRERTAVATATGLPRYARNDTSEWVRPTLGGPATGG